MAGESPPELPPGVLPGVPVRLGSRAEKAAPPTSSRRPALPLHSDALDRVRQLARSYTFELYDASVAEAVHTDGPIVLKTHVEHARQRLVRRESAFWLADVLMTGGLGVFGFFVGSFATELSGTTPNTATVATYSALWAVGIVLFGGGLLLRALKTR